MDTIISWMIRAVEGFRQCIRRVVMAGWYEPTLIISFFFFVGCTPDSGICMHTYVSLH